MAESKVFIRCPSSSSPPPNCAICLGNFSNKCFSDSCMHEFCFKCLLQWSKIKPECPLCKQPFTRIIHNVKSNEEYDEHVVEITPPEEVLLIDNEENLLFLPRGQSQQSTRHHFHFRTTFTVDTNGEHAIQQMLLTHPHISVSTSGFVPPINVYHRRRVIRERESTTSFRRSIYIRHLWAIPIPDVTGRYRDVSPSFFRVYPAARTRLAPWLNRELNAILYENTQLVMRLVDIIMEQLLRNHVRSRAFHNLLFEYLDSETEHFIHEFYNFMRSPFDMIGYDRHVVYSMNPHTVTIDDGSESGNDSDVIIVGSSNPQEPVVIDLVDSDSDDPIVVPDDSPTPPASIAVRDNTPEQEARAPVLPLKLRLKNKRRSREEEREKRYRKKSKRYRSSSSSSDSSWKSSERHRRKKKPKKSKKRRSSSTDSDSSDSGKDVPKLRGSARILNRHKSSKTNQGASSNEVVTRSAADEGAGCSGLLLNIGNFEGSLAGVPIDPDRPSCSRYSCTPTPRLAFGSPASTTSWNESTDDEFNEVKVKSEVKVKTEGERSAKPSERLRNITLKKENSSNTWYTYHPDYDSSSPEY
ncbi:unnamed protein product [Phyllotreta striolata]|uniref:E3 ubiquitin-protein ligase Topors n=1 Tax=Phyllotreta striolata TaxID=444603 RepID=A0A9N9XM67_PHYSR|nr:unnamed protein product [Phyllotreta striolata]